jgi:hypothetical protein
VSTRSDDKLDQVTGLRVLPVFSETVSAYGFKIECSRQIKETMRFGALPAGAPGTTTDRQGAFEAYDRDHGHSLAATWFTVGQMSDWSFDWERRLERDRVLAEVRDMANGEVDFKIEASGEGQVEGHNQQIMMYSYAQPGARAYGITSVWLCKESGRQWMLGAMGDDSQTIRTMLSEYSARFCCH